MLFSPFVSFETAVDSDPVRPLNNVKIYGSDEATEQSDLRRHRRGDRAVWRNVFGGCAAARLHRPPYGIGISDLARAAIQGARTITDELDLLACEPHNELRAGWRHNVGSCAFPTPETEAYVLVDGGETPLEADLSGLTCR